MEMKEYQTESDGVAVYPEKGDFIGLTYTVLGLAGEAGEVANLFKKAIRDNGCTVPADMREKMIMELGDVLWYLSQTATELGVSLETVALLNREKLEDRKARGRLKGSGDRR